MVISLHVYSSLFLQLLLSAVLLGSAYVAPENLHFGWWCLSRYSVEQRERVVPLLRVLTGWLSLLVSAFFAACIYLWIHSALSLDSGPLSDWIAHAGRLQLEGLAALVVVCGLLIRGWIGKFDNAATKVRS